MQQDQEGDLAGVSLALGIGRRRLRPALALLALLFGAADKWAHNFKIVVPVMAPQKALHSGSSYFLLTFLLKKKTWGAEQRAVSRQAPIQSCVSAPSFGSFHSTPKT